MVLRVTREKLIFILHEKVTGGGIGSSFTAGIIGSQGQGLGFGGGAGAIAWCELPVQTYFSEFDMEGITPQDDEIYMQISAGTQVYFVLLA